MVGYMEPKTSTQVATHKKVRRTSKCSAYSKEGDKMMCPICLKTKKGGLHTIYCHKCGKAMTYPYEECGELYHNQCLPSQPVWFRPSYDPPSLARCEQVQLFKQDENKS